MVFKCRKIVGSRGCAPHPTGGAQGASPDPLASNVPLHDPMTRAIKPCNRPSQTEPQNPPCLISQLWLKRIHFSIFK